MNNENELKTTAMERPLEKGEPKEWVFIPLLKKHIIKRTETYLLFDVDGTASGIVSAKFLRKKESDEMVYLSLPASYEINCNVREKVDGKWTATKKYVINAKDLRPIVIEYNKDLPF